MIFLQNKTVIITGAGFSAPANLPIQNRILQEMVKTDSSVQDFLDADIGRESSKFLDAYIHVALYLLKEYSNVSVDEYSDLYDEVSSRFSVREKVIDIIEYIMSSSHVKKAEEKDFNLIDVIDDVSNKFYSNNFEHYTGLLYIKERLREQLYSSDIKISLEDVFTLFDKSINQKEHILNYTYSEIDKLQHSILRLFIYYFSKRVNEHDYNNSDYLQIINYIGKNKDSISLITTNWDILLEEYLSRNNIQYSYKFNSAYVLDEDGDVFDKELLDNKKISYIKLHGSINWFRCLSCGTLQIYNTASCGNYLFDDEKQEKCLKCGQVSVGEEVQIKPEIITPTMIKSITGQLYNNLWQNAAYELQQAEKIIFCGYSLPMADYEFRYLLKKNIQVNTEIDVVLYHDDDPNKSGVTQLANFLPEKRYRDLFPNNRCSFFYGGFGEYFKSNNI